MTDANIGELPITILINHDLKADGILYAYNGPQIISAIANKIPLNGRVRIYNDDQLFIPIGIKSGIQKGTTSVEEGDIAYWAIGDAFCIFRNSMKTYSQVNVIGKIVSGIENVKAITKGATLEILKS